MTDTPLVYVGPADRDVADLTHLLDLMETFASNEQRARYLLSSDWLRERGAAAAQRNAVGLAHIVRNSQIIELQHGPRAGRGA